MHYSSRIVVVCCALLAAASTASALGFGRVNNATVLGSTLDFSVAISPEADEALPSDCVSAEVVAGEVKLPSGWVQVKLDTGPNARPSAVRVATNVKIDEPVVTITLTLGCARSWTRSFVAFVDPPVMVQAPTLQISAPSNPVSQSASPVLAGTDSTGFFVSTTVSAPSSPISTGAPASSAAGSVPEARVQSASDPMAQLKKLPTPAQIITAGAVPFAVPSEPAHKASAPKQRAPRTPAKPVAALNAKSSASAAKPLPRLSLEPAAVAPVKALPLLAITPKLAAVAEPASGSAAAKAAASAPLAAASVTAASAATAATAALTADQQLATETERLKALEDSLNALRTDNQSTQKTIAGLQSRLHEAENSQFANPLVYTLAGVVALLLIAVAGLMWRLSTLRRKNAWWASATGAGTQQPGDAVGTGVTLDSPPPKAPGSAPTAFASEDNDPAWAPSTSAEARGYVHTQPLPAQEPRRELAVEELIDLEQQADFFVVLGQDEAAIELLVGHLRESGGASPLPYLKLLEIYRRRGDRDAYEKTRERFNQQFNAYAPDWESDPSEGRSLEDVGDVLRRLQGVWRSASKAKALLESLLFRSESQHSTFDLAAYGELLLLYSVARDLADREGSNSTVDDGVDFMIPMGDSPVENTAIFPMTSTMPVPPYTGPAAQLDQKLDLELDLEVDMAMSLPKIDLSATKPS